MSDTILSEFSQAGDIRGKWDAARRLMAAKQMQAVSDRSEFLRGFHDIGEISIHASGMDQLLAIDLLVRISELVKKHFRRQAGEILSRALERTPEGTWTIVESKSLPPEAKPAEIRENIAIALAHAVGPWVLRYVVEALAREDRSQRCRLELCRQLAAREPLVGRWIEMLGDQPWSEIANGVDRVGRLRDLAAALAITVRTNRAKVSIDKTFGPSLATLARKVVAVSAHGPLPPKLSQAAIELVGLLEEVIASEITVATEPDAYAVVEVLSRWWHPISYPPDLAAVLAGLARKLIGAVTLRARMGQRSEALVSRLSQALGGGRSAAEVLVKIADTESGLVSQIDDWLRGREREPSTTAVATATLLAGAASADFITAFAPLLLDCADAMAASRESSDPRLAAHLRRIAGRVDGIALSLQLSISGQVGELVEYNANAYQTLDGSIPREPHVKIVRPMVVRRRPDGSNDVIEPAMVSID